MKHFILTPADWSVGLHAGCRQLRTDWPSSWPGLPHILALCQRSLGLDSAGDSATVSLNQFALSVAQAMEKDVQPALEPAYHNRRHTADVLLVLTTLLHILGAPYADLADQQWAGALLAAATSHDFKHPGGVNRVAFEIEQMSWQAVSPLAKDLPLAWRQRVEAWILGTDVPTVKGNHQRVANQAFGWSAPWAQVLLNEADIFVSATPEFGPSLGVALACEWQQVGFAAYNRVATAAGRAEFLRSAQFSSPAAQALGIQAQVQEQLAALSRQE